MQRRLRIFALGFGLVVLITSQSATASEDFSFNPGAFEQPTSQENARGAGPIRGDGVVVATGNKIEAEQDFAVDEEMGLYLRRTYNHHWSGIGLFGKHWLSNFDYSLSFSSGVAWAQRPDGRRIKFYFDSTTSRWNEDKTQPIAYIVRNGDNSYTLYNEERGSETYSADGYILQRRNEQGLAWTFTYSGTYLQRVTHTSGRSVQFTWANGQVVQVTDPAGNIYQYTYTPDIFGAGRGRLATTVLPGAPTTTITYYFEDARYPGGLTGKSFNGVRYSTFAYDDQARAIKSEHAGGVDRYTFSYVVESTQSTSLPPPSPAPGGYLNQDESGGCVYRSGTKICYQAASIGAASPLYSMASVVFAAVATTTTTTQLPTRVRVTETNPLGRQTIYVLENNRLVSVESGTKYGERTYDANGYVNLVHDFESGISDYDYDAHGHLLKKVEAVGSSAERTTTYVWDEANNRLLKETLLGQRETIYAYTANGRLETLTEKNLSARGIANQSRQTTYQYTYQAGNLLATKVVDGPVAGSVDAITYTYGTTGLLDRVSNGAGHVTTYTNYNGLGQAGRTTGPNGDVTEYTYDARGRITAEKPIVNGVAQTTTNTYNGAGQLASVKTPDGRQQNFVYDAALRLLEQYEREAAGTYARQLTTYNAMSLPTKVEVQRSTYPYNTRIIGNIDGVTGDAGSGFSVYGWACSTGQDAPVDVHFYAGGAAGTGTGVTAATANRPSEAAVAAACEGQGATYRFQIPLTDAIRDVHGGKLIYIHGISPSGSSNLLISSSGIHSIPRLPPNVAPAGLSAPAQVTNGSYSVTWSATARATAYRLEESVNGAAWATVYTNAANSAAISGKTAGAYRYRVAACNESGCGPVSGEVSVVEIDPPAAAPVLTAPSVNATGSYTVTWNAVSGATSYRLEESANGGAWVQVHDAAATSLALSSKSTAIPYAYRGRACNAAGCSAYSGAASVQQIIYGADYVSQSAPTLMAAGQYYNVSVQMRNTGNTTWTNADAYRLGSLNPGDNTTWGTNRIPLTTAVAPGSIATFTYAVRAPSTAGAYNFQWRMVRDGYTWFGASTPNVGVAVASGSISAGPNPCSLYIGQTACTTRITWSSTRGDAQVWATNIDNSGPQLFASGQSGGQYASWITQTGTRFHLKSGGVTLATVDVYAYQTNQYPPEPDPPPCPTKYCQEP
jgi:YD repeat-containing protein